eukprot:491251-Rhodomonas_salina.3
MWRFLLHAGVASCAPRGAVLNVVAAVPMSVGFCAPSLCDQPEMRLTSGSVDARPGICLRWPQDEEIGAPAAVGGCTEWKGGPGSDEGLLDRL